MTDGIFPGATYRPVRFTGKTGPMAADPAGWVLHVAEMNGSPWGVFDRSRIGRRKVSTGWVAKDGTVEQYVPATQRPWAQGAGNGRYHAWETEGYATEPLTASQVEALAEIHVWHGADDRLAEVPGERGIGTHYMGGAPWGAHSCPGSIRAAQRVAVLSAARSQRLGDVVPITDADARKIADIVAVRYQVHSPLGGGLVTRDAAIGAVWEQVVSLRQELDDLRRLLADREAGG